MFASFHRWPWVLVLQLPQRWKKIWKSILSYHPIQGIYRVNYLSKAWEPDFSATSITDGFCARIGLQEKMLKRPQLVWLKHCGTSRMFLANHLMIMIFADKTQTTFVLKPLHPIGHAPYKLLRPFAGRSLPVSVLDLGCSTAMTIPSFLGVKNTNLNALLKYAEIHKGYISWIQNSHEFPIQPTFRMAGGFCHPNLIVLLAKKSLPTAPVGTKQLEKAMCVTSRATLKTRTR